MMPIIPSNVLNFILSCLVVLLTTYSQIILRLKLGKFSKILSSKNFDFFTCFQIITDFWVLSSIIAFGMGFVCWSLALMNNINVARFYPIVTSVTILLIWLISIIVFKDDVNIYNGMGVVAVISGIFLLLMN